MDVKSKSRRPPTNEGDGILADPAHYASRHVIINHCIFLTTGIKITWLSIRLDSCLSVPTTCRPPAATTFTTTFQEKQLLRGCTRLTLTCSTNPKGKEVDDWLVTLSFIGSKHLVGFVSPSRACSNRNLKIQHVYRFLFFIRVSLVLR